MGEPAWNRGYRRREQWSPLWTCVCLNDAAGGATIHNHNVGEPCPLYDGQPEPPLPRCRATRWADGTGARCKHVAGHGGPHQAHHGRWASDPWRGEVSR